MAKRLTIIDKIHELHKFESYVGISNLLEITPQKLAQIRNKKTKPTAELKKAINELYKEVFPPPPRKRKPKPKLAITLLAQYRDYEGFEKVAQKIAGYTYETEGDIYTEYGQVTTLKDPKTDFAFVSYIIFTNQYSTSSKEDDIIDKIEYVTLSEATQDRDGIYTKDKILQQLYIEDETEARTKHYEEKKRSNFLGLTPIAIFMT